MMSRAKRKVLAIRLIKGHEQYVFRFRPEKLTELLRCFGRLASDRESSFTWWDAAVMGEQARKMVKQEAARAAGGGE
jgi:hypothetical protein